MSDPPRRRPRRGITDLQWVLLAPLAVFAFASAFELFERYERLTARLERFQLDEIVFALVALAAALAWYGWRRWREAQAALAAHRRVQARNRELAQRLLVAQESERHALARELHDELGQACTAIRVEAAVLAQSHADGDAAAVAAGAERIGAAADALHERVGRLLLTLRPPDLDALGLVAALRALCESWELTSGLPCVCHADDAFEGCGDAVDVALYRIAQEALSNVMRHARASAVRVVLRRDAGAVVLEVHDDGVGFDPDGVARGFGLLGLAERAAGLGGRVALRSRPGGGTAVVATLPVPR